MGWVENLRGKLVALDTSPFIYYIEEKPIYVDMLRPFFAAVRRREIDTVTSTITLLEVLVHPYMHGDANLVTAYRNILFHSYNHTTVNVTREIAETAAWLRASSKMRTPDSIQLATAINAGASFFLTNDARFPSSNQIQILELDKLMTKH